jgi:secondary thiamine-phosphate synthase enzyme
MTKISIQTDQSDQVIDLTEKINAELKKMEAGSGVCMVSVAHTTCCLTTADLDPGTDKDLLEAVRKIFPEGDYRHPHNPGHVGDHIMSSIIGPSVIIPVKNSRLILGTWQRIVLIELNGPRTRNLNLHLLTGK